MKGLLAAEWTKVTKRKLAWILALVSVLLSGIGTAFTLILADLLEGSEELILPAPTKPEAYTSALQSAAGNTWVPIILVTVIVAGEYAKGTWPVSLTWNANRMQHVVAKFVVLTAVSFVIIAATAAVTLLITLGLADGTGFLSGSEIVVALGKVLLVQVAWVGLSFLGAALFRSAALAVGLTLGFSFAEQIFGLLPLYRRISLSNAVTGLFGEFDFTGILPIYVPEPPVAATVLAVWALASVAVAGLLISKRDA